MPYQMRRTFVKANISYIFVKLPTLPSSHAGPLLANTSGGCSAYSGEKNKLTYILHSQYIGYSQCL